MSLHSIDIIFLSFKNGEEKGFAFFFNLHYKALHYFAMGLLKDEALAEDVVETSFLKLYEKRTTIQSAITIKSFLYTTVRNHCLDKIKQQKRRKAHNKSFAYLQDNFEFISFKEEIKTQTLAIVLEAIEELPPVTQKVFKLFYLEGKSYDQIAEELNRSKETIRSQKKNGLTMIRKKLLFFLF